MVANCGSCDLKEAPSTVGHPPNQFMPTAQMLSSSTSVGSSNTHNEKGALLKKIKPKINYKRELEMFCLQAALGFSSHPKKANVLLL